MKKLVDLETLPIFLSFPDRRRSKVVQVHGVFDVLHLGHARHFEQAKSYGDILVVSVTSDRYVNKGSDRPIFNHLQRAEMISYMESVDYVVISDYPDASKAISVICPDVLCKGIDYADKGTSQVERDAVAAVGGKLIYTTTEKYSTTEIVNKLKEGK